MSPNEMDLRQTLQQDAERIDARGDFATAAIGLERRRARRRTTLTAGVAALAAAAVPFLWSPSGPTGGLAPAASPTAPASPTASGPTPAETTKSGPAPTPASKFAATIGTGPVTGKPSVAYALDGVFHDGDRRITLPTKDSLQLLARLDGGGVLVQAAPDDGMAPIQFLDASGAVVAVVDDAQDATVNATGARVVVADQTGSLRVYDPRGVLVANLDTGDENTRPTGIWGDIIYYSTVDASGKSFTRSWDVTGTATRAVVEGSFAAIHEDRALAILWPNQDYDPGNNCYGIFDLKAGSANPLSCGQFAPSDFTADGTMVFGPEVADGAGSSNWRVASSEHHAVVMTVAAPKGVWAPSWSGAGSADAIVVAPLGKRDTEQTIASCVVSTGECTTDLGPVTLSREDADMMRYPITLSVN
jgi:hypothetical protein